MRSGAFVSLAAAFLATAAFAQGDLCRRPDIVTYLTEGLQKTPHYAGAHLENISTSFVSSRTGNSGPLYSCHVTIVEGSGVRMAGTVSYIEATPGNVRLDWVSDADRKLRGAVVPLKKKRGFRGDIASWSGIPPLPPGASETKTATATSHCTIGDAADHMLSMWMSHSDCVKWLKDAEALAASGPTPDQIRRYRIAKCAEQLGGQGTQSYSEQPYELCMGIDPHPVDGNPAQGRY